MRPTEIELIKLRRRLGVSIRALVSCRWSCREPLAIPRASRVLVKPSSLLTLSRISLLVSSLKAPIFILLYHP